jgi:hypothetical protein
MRCQVRFQPPCAVSDTKWLSPARANHVIQTTTDLLCLRFQLRAPILLPADSLQSMYNRLQRADAFSWCDNEGVNHCSTSWNQHIPQYCGSCYAHGTLAMLNDRLKILKGGMDVMLGRQTFLNCAPLLNFSAGCDGGDPIDVRPISCFTAPLP